MKANIVNIVSSKNLFACPDCGSLEHSCDHLQVGQSFGPWFCDKCGCSVKGVVTSDGADIDRGTKRKANALVLLRLDATGLDAKPIHIVVSGMTFHEEGEPAIFGDSGMRYFYDEGTCPWNYLRFPIKEGNDADPHGLFVFQEAVPMPEGYDGSLDDIDQWLELFPSLRA